MFCAISGIAPEQPCVSKTTGTVYERRLIEKYIRENGRDPLSGQTLDFEDLIDVKSTPKAVAPRPAHLSSIPGLLAALQSEWDASAIETFQLRQQYHATRQQLSAALYANDAALRTLARMQMERDEARNALAAVGSSTTVEIDTKTNGNAAGAMEIEQEEEALDETYVKQIQDAYKRLSANRDKNKNARGVADTPSQEQMSSAESYAEQKSLETQHSGTKPGITAIQATASLVFTAGMDHHVIVTDVEKDAVVATLKGHTKPVTCIAVREDGAEVLLASGSDDKKVKVYSSADKWKAVHTLTDHASEIVSVLWHPTGLLVSVSANGTYCLHQVDRSSASLIFRKETGTACQSAALHPDGVLLGLAQGSKLCLYDLTTAHLEASLEVTSTVSSVAFSENGYIVACASANDGKVSVFDLRNPDKEPTVLLGSGKQVHALGFDVSAHFLAIAGKTEVEIFKSKKWTSLRKIAHAAESLTWNGGKLLLAEKEKAVYIFGRT